MFALFTAQQHRKPLPVRQFVERNPGVQQLIIDNFSKSQLAYPHVAAAVHRRSYITA